MRKSKKRRLRGNLVGETEGTEFPAEIMALVEKEKNTSSLIEKVRNRKESRKRGVPAFWSEMCEMTLQNIDEGLSQKDTDITKQKQFIEILEQRLSEEKEILKRAREKVSKTENELAKARECYTSLEKSREKLKKSGAQVKELQREYETVVFVHRTATLEMICRYHFATIVVNKWDFNEIIADIGPDAIIDPNEIEELITQLPYGFEEKYSAEEKASIINYCNMAAKMKMLADDKDVCTELVYYNPDITEILRLNGIDV